MTESAIQSARDKPRAKRRRPVCHVTLSEYAIKEGTKAAKNLGLSFSRYVEFVVRDDVYRRRRKLDYKLNTKEVDSGPDIHSDAA